MELDVSLSWLALVLTPGLACRLSARLLRQFGSPDGIFRASLRELEACHLPSQAAQAVFKKEEFARRKRGSGDSKDPGMPGAQLDGTRISTNTLTDL